MRYNIFMKFVNGIVARQAFYYSLGVAIIGALIALIDYANDAIRDITPNYPIWVPSIILAVLIMTMVVFVWKHLREGDILKYEFITTATHKFRTPLTHIKWATENLLKADLSDDSRLQLEYIQSANGKLVELTNLLMNISGHENVRTDYHFETGNLAEVVEQTILSLKDQFDARHIILEKSLDHDSKARFDPSRIRFVVQTFLENAIHYSPENSKLSVSLTKENEHFHFSVTDNGIGIPKEETSRLFSKFYRGSRAKVTDTEGMGIGLFMSKEIIKRHHGKIWAESAGLNKGSTFNFYIRA